MMSSLVFCIFPLNKFLLKYKKKEKKIPITKRAGRVAQGEGPEFKPQYHIKRK
jgi:hypothetical protein